MNQSLISPDWVNGGIESDVERPETLIILVIKLSLMTPLLVLERFILLNIGKLNIE